jgi:hypothetical protein
MICYLLIIIYNISTFSQKTPSVIQYNQIRDLSNIEEVPFDFSFIMYINDDLTHKIEEYESSLYNYSPTGDTLDTVGKFSDCNTTSSNSFYERNSNNTHFPNTFCINQLIKNVKMGGSITNFAIVKGYITKPLYNGSNLYMFSYLYPNKLFNIYEEEGYTSYDDIEYVISCLPKIR